MMHTTAQALGRAHLADLHRQAQKDAPASAARKARRQRSGPRAPRILSVVTAWARRPRPAPESP
jgi:hypothetical protein